MQWGTNSIIVTTVVTAGRVFFDSLAGYALARIPFRGRGVVFALLIAVMAVPGVVLLIPKFLVINQLGIYDSYTGMIVPLLADALTTLECTIVAEHPAGDHWIVVARVTRLRTSPGDDPLIFFGGAFGALGPAQRS